MSQQQPYEADWTSYIQFAGGLTQKELALRDSFVREYMHDYNSTNAALRCGFMGVTATEYGVRLLQDNYVQWKIRDMENKRKSADEEERADYAEQERQRIIEALKYEAHYTGPGASQAARVSALGKLAQIFDLDAPKKSKVSVEHKGGVLMVPQIANVDAWEQVAADSQDKLVKDTNDNS